MTIAATTTEVSYTGNGSTTAFTVTFAFFGTGTAAELEVIERVIATGAETTKSNGSHYTVTGGSGSTGTVTAASAPADTVQWHIRRKTTQTQGTDYVENDEFPADSHENALDRLTMIAQEHEADIADAFTFPPSYTAGASTTMPEPVANSYLVWNADGDALTTSTSSAAQYLGGNGTASLPFYSFSSDPNSGIYRVGADNVGVAVGGSKVVDITSTGINGTAIGASTAAAGTFSSITSGGDILSDTDSTDSLGSTGVRWLKAWIDSIQTTADIDVGANLTVAGNLTVNGSTVTNSVTNQVIADPLIELNNGAGSNANDLGFIFERGSTGDNGFMGWDESGDFFTVGTTSATGSSTGNITYSFAPFKCSAITATSGTLAGITSLGLNAGATITDGILDEDAMGSNSAVALATQQSIKAYVDNSAPEAGVKFAFESTTTDTDQGAGKGWLNHGTPSSATVVYIDDVEAGGVSVNAWVDTFDDVSNSVARGYLYIASYGSTNAILVTKLRAPSPAHRRIPR